MEDIIPVISVLVEALIVLAVTLIIARIYKHVYRKITEKKSVQLFHVFVYNAVLVAIYAIGALSAVSAIPQLSNLASTLLAGSGIVALALSLSAQESLSNVVSGLFITLFKPFEVGDRITVVGKDVTGYVESITLRHTIIKTLTNTRVVIPNSAMNTEVIENTELIDRTSSYFLDVQVAYESDLQHVCKVIEEVVFNHPLYIQDNPVVVQLRAFESSGIALRTRVWTKTVDDNFKACSDIRFALFSRFKQEGIEIPYSKVVIYNGSQAS